MYKSIYDNHAPNLNLYIYILLHPVFINSLEFVKEKKYLILKV